MLTSKDALNFVSFNLPANPIGSPVGKITHHNANFVVNKLNWTEIFEDTNYPAIIYMTHYSICKERRI